MNDIAAGLDVPCDKCRKLRKQGYPRPSCEECGLVDLTEANSLVWEIFSEYGPVVLTANGFGSINVNVEALKEVLKEYRIDSLPVLMARLVTLASELMKKESDE